MLGGGGLYLCVFTHEALLASPLPVEPCILGWEGPSNLSCFFTRFMTMGLSSGILNSKHEVKVLVAQSCPTLCNPMNCIAR